jgi:hypothetical protein
MKCAQCNKTISTLNTVKVKRYGVKTSLSFCCYKHYLDFWSDVMGFKPLQEWQETNRGLFTNVQKSADSTNNT